MSYSTTYERMTGGCTSHLAREMLNSASPPLTSSSYILDNACGPGIVTAEIKARYPSAKVMAADLNPGMIEELLTRKTKNGWTDVQTSIEDVRFLQGIEDETFTHVLTNLGMPVPGDESSVSIARQMFRVLKSGGVAIASTWADRVFPAAYLRTARVVRPGEEPKNALALPAEKLSASWLLRNFEEGGFGNNVAVRPAVTYTSASSYDELVENMMLAAPMFWGGYSEEEMVKAKTVFREELQKVRTFERLEDGSVRIGMKAWIATGWKKGDEGEEPL